MKLDRAPLWMLTLALVALVFPLLAAAQERSPAADEGVTTIDRPTAPFSEAPLKGEPNERTFASIDAARAFVAAGRTADLVYTSPSAFLEAKHDMLFKHTVVTFHSMWLQLEGDAERRRVWIARRRELHGDRTRTSYAHCATVRHVLLNAERLQMPEVDFAGVPEGLGPPRETEDGSNLHDFAFTFSTDSAVFPRDRTIASLRITGGSLTPVGAWAVTSIAALEPCWGPTPLHGVALASGGSSR